MWELATRRVPYEDLAPFEAVRRACDENLRPPIPQNCLFESLIVQCWDRNPETRPDFATIVDALEEIANVVGSDSLKAYESGSEVEEEEAQYQYEKINTIIGRTLRGRAGDGSTFGSKKFASRPKSPFPMSSSSSSSASASVLPVTSSSSPIVPAASSSSLPQPVPSSSSSSGSTSPAISGTKAITRSTSRRLKQSSFDATLLKDDSQDPPPTLTQQSFSNPLIQSHPPATSTTSSPSLAPSPLSAGVSSLSISEGSSQSPATRSTSTGEAPDNGICPTCNKDVLGQKLKAIGRTFHPDCFVCFHCKGKLQGSFCRHQDKPYCNEDYKKLFMPHCARCQQLLTSQYLNALNKSWHRECFVCTRCSGPMKAYYDVGGFPYCDNCCNRT